MLGTPGIIAYLALIIWLPISLGLFALYRPTVAASLVLLGAMLFLPARMAIDFPGFPALDKELMANFCALAGVLIFARRRLSRQRIGRGIDSLVFLLMVGAALTTFTNRDPLFYGPTVLPALSLWDAISSSIQQLFNFGIPFVLGRVLFARSRDLRLLLRLLVVAGLVYSVLVLYEVRMSPQLHRMTYGYYQHFFHMTLRLDGYRPMVFMPHGLALSLFALVTMMAATSLARARVNLGPIPTAAAAVYLSGVLVLCRSLGAILYGVVIFPIIVVMNPRWQLRIASLLAILVLAYPTTRALGLFPTDAMVSFAHSISEKRAQSLQFRFDNEDFLLEKAEKRVWFGWGGYNRNRVFDQRTGEVDTITDGFWIIQLGSKGAVGFIGAFGLLLLPIWHAHWKFSRIRSGRDRRLIAGLALMLAIYSVDLIPNGFLLSFSLFLSGALTGLVTGLQVESQRRLSRRRSRGSAPSAEADSESEGALTPGNQRLSESHQLQLPRVQQPPLIAARAGINS